MNEHEQNVQRSAAIMEQQMCIYEHIVKQTALLQNILDTQLRICALVEQTVAHLLPNSNQEPV
jgi:hypothetical protein